MSSFLNLNAFAAKLTISRQTAAKYINDGVYPAFKNGSTYKIHDGVFKLKEIEEYEQETYNGSIPCSTVMIGNHKGGTGKTTSTINLAASLAFMGKRVLIVDMDTQANASTINNSHLLHDFDTYNVTNLLLNMKQFSKEELSDEIKKTIVNIEYEQFRKGTLDLMPNSLELDEKKELLFTYANAENMLNRLLKTIRADYDYILIDTHPSMDIVWRMSVMASDYVIIGLKPERYSIEGLGGIFKRIYNLNDDYKEIKYKNIEVLGAIITDYKKNTKIAKHNVPIILEAMSNFCKYNTPIVFEPFVSHSVKASEQQSLRGPIMFDEPYSPMCAEYLDIALATMIKIYHLESEREGEVNE